MHKPDQPSGFKSKELLRQEFDQKMAEIQDADHDYDGQTAESGYSKAILELLKDPVSLGLVGSNFNRGHQR